MSAAADEIAKIEHELDILRSRYAIFARWAKITKWFFIGAAAAILLALIFYGHHDPLAGAIVGAIFVVTVSGLYLTRDDTTDRWIDVASPSVGPAWRISEARAIERMIAERETRLAEIRRAGD